MKDSRFALGFTLAELLVSLGLLSVVVLMVGLLLAGMRNAADELLAAPRELQSDAFQQLESDLLHLSQMGDAEGVFTLLPGEGARWQRLMRDAEGRWVAVAVQYPEITEGGDWLRVMRAAAGSNADAVVDAVSTNVLRSGVTSLRLSASAGDGWYETWPPEGQEGPPGMVRVTLEDEAGLAEALFLVPAALRVEAGEAGEGGE